MHSFIVGSTHGFSIVDYGSRENAYYHARLFAGKWGLTVYNQRDVDGELTGYIVK